jgi:periplasmic protein TonB
MAYADQGMSGSRIVAIVIVALIHAIIGYAFVTGLAYQYVKKASENMDVFDVEEPPPPPEEVPPPPPEAAVPPPPTTVVVQKPLVQVPSPPVSINMTNVIPPAPPPVAPPAPPAPPPPPAPVVNKAAGPKGNPASWITNDDYPQSSLRAEEEGTTAITWDINAQGRVENCRVTSSSGHPALDRAACAALTRRARYSPALDQSGNPIRSSQSRRVTWRIPQD